MQIGQRIWKDCTECHNTGKQYQDPSGAIQSKSGTGRVEVDCPTCNGLSIIPWGWLRDEKEDTMPGEEA